MKLDKNQVPQVVALGVLLLICIGYVGIKFTKKPAVPPAQPPTSASQTQTPSQSQTEDGAVKTPESISDQLLDQQLAALPPVKQRDPFAPQLMAQLPHAVVPGQHASQNRPVRQIEVPKTPPPRMARLPGFGMNVGVEPITVPVTDPNQPAQQPLDQLKVTGIIRGERSVAIIRSADERHIVREGQWINEYKVDAITEDGVVLVGKERRISLKLGGEKNAS